MALILAHDLGTTGNKANLFDETGTLVASHLEGYGVEYLRAGWAEQNPNDWWRAVCDSTRALLQTARAKPRDIAVVTFSGQMMGVIALDADDRPLRSAIIWADQRSTAEAALIAERCGADEIYRRTGHRVSPSYSAAKILWIKRNQPDLFAQARRFMMAKDYAALKLTGQAVTDHSDASGSNLFELESREWCTDFLDRLEIDIACLPRVCASTDVIGYVTSAASEATGLVAGTPVVIGGGDGACATVGAGVVDDGDAYCVLGTSSWIAFTSQHPLLDPQQRTFTFCNLPRDRYMPTGTMQSAGAAREWLIHTMGEQNAPNDDAIAMVELGCNGLLFLPYLIGERSPWWNPKARAAFVGLTMNHGAAEMSRAVLEGVAFNLKIILDALSAHAPFKSLRLIGGGARSKLWQRILADVFGIPLEIPELLAEATSWGAAVAGGIGVGLYHDWPIAKAQTNVKEVIEPNSRNAARYAELYMLFQDTYRALAPIYGRM
jgi:xylulokinase